jgi:hypothetical protein
MDSEEYFEIEPNRVAEYYRNFHPLPTSAKVEKHLDFIDVCEGMHCMYYVHIYRLCMIHTYYVYVPYHVPM